MSGLIRMYRSGLLIDPLSPDPASIFAADIAYGLAGTFRYRGQSRLTVAEHAVRGCDWIGIQTWGTTALQWEFLNHDDAEYLLADVPSPVKKQLAGYKTVEEHVEAIVAERLRFATVKSPEVHRLDVQMRYDEQRVIWGRLPLPEDEYEEVRVYPHGAGCRRNAQALSAYWWPPGYAEMRWMERFFQLSRALGLEAEIWAAPEMEPT